MQLVAPVPCSSLGDDCGRALSEAGAMAPPPRIEWAPGRAVRVGGGGRQGKDSRGLSVGECLGGRQGGGGGCGYSGCPGPSFASLTAQGHRAARPGPAVGEGVHGTDQLPGIGRRLVEKVGAPSSFQRSRRRCVPSSSLLPAVGGDYTEKRGRTPASWRNPAKGGYHASRHRGQQSPSQSMR